MPRVAACHRRGWTLWDLIVFLAILAVVTAIIASFGFRIQCASQRAKCLNNIRLIALACHNCNDAEGALPPYHSRSGGGLPADSSYARPGNDGSVLFFLTPFIESGPTFSWGEIQGPKGLANSVYATLPAEAFSKNFTWDKAHCPAPTGQLTDPPTEPFLAQLPIRGFLCPADPTVTADGVQPEAGLGACSYACNYLVFGNPATPASDPPLDNPDGYYAAAQPPRVAPACLPRLKDSFPDGLSRTLLFAEKLSICGWYKGGSILWPEPGGNLWAPAGDSARYAPAFAMESPWNDGTTFQVRPSQSECNAAYPSTGHIGGMVVALADASGRTLARDITPTVFRALCTPNCGETIPPDW